MHPEHVKVCAWLSYKTDTYSQMWSFVQCNTKWLAYLPRAAHARFRATIRPLVPGHDLCCDPKISIWVGFFKFVEMSRFYYLFFLKAFAYCNSTKNADASFFFCSQYGDPNIYIYIYISLFTCINVTKYPSQEKRTWIQDLVQVTKRWGIRYKKWTSTI
jgi:hypothetical protein